MRSFTEISNKFYIDVGYRGTPFVRTPHCCSDLPPGAANLIALRTAPVRGADSANNNASSAQNVTGSGRRVYRTFKITVAVRNSWVTRSLSMGNPPRLLPKEERNRLSYEFQYFENLHLVESSP